jgi:hypothetical protein
MSKIPGYKSIATFERVMGLAEGTAKRQMQRGYCAWPRIINDGRKTHSLYKQWRSIIDRCYVKSHTSYENYGGRGIRVGATWRLDFWHFVKDIENLGPKPESCTLDRIDNTGDYEPGNVRWANPSDQNMNQRTHKDNTSGLRGLSYNNRDRLWAASIQYKGSQYRKSFKSRQDAIDFITQTRQELNIQ